MTCAAAWGEEKCCCAGFWEELLPSFGERRNGTKKIREMDKLPDFRDDPTTKIKTAISFCMYLQIG
jgi:hypothetical protein